MCIRDRQSTIWVERWSEPSIGTTRSRRNVWHWCLLFRKCENATHLAGQTINVISKVNPLRLLMTKPSSLNGWLAKWVILLSQYEMHFLPQKAIKGQAVADFLAEHPDPRAAKVYEDSQMKWPKSVWLRHRLKVKCGNSSLMVHPEQAQKDT